MKEDWRYTTTGTAIREPVAEIVPREGMALCFEHELLHAGQTVLSGNKYIIRADLMFERAL